MDVEGLYSTYYMRIYSYALGMVRNPSAAEEIAQDTFSRALVSGGYRGEAGEYTWLCAIAKNLCNDYFREQGRRADGEIENQDSVAGCEDDYILKETSFAVHKLLHELEEPYKEVFELRVFGELSFADIARIFGKTESWARVTYHRARLKMKERMDRNGTDTTM